jgi:hypothetical protein
MRVQIRVCIVVGAYVFSERRAGNLEVEQLAVRSGGNANQKWHDTVPVRGPFNDFLTSAGVSSNYVLIMCWKF